MLTSLLSMIKGDRFQDKKGTVWVVGELTDNPRFVRVYANGNKRAVANVFHSYERVQK